MLHVCVELRLQGEFAPNSGSRKFSECAKEVAARLVRLYLHLLHCNAWILIVSLDADGSGSPLEFSVKKKPSLAASVSVYPLAKLMRLELHAWFRSPLRAQAK
jgi:hypothetical protein